MDSIKNETNEEAKLWLKIKLNGLLAEVANAPKIVESRAGNNVQSHLNTTDLDNT